MGGGGRLSLDAGLGGCLAGFVGSCGLLSGAFWTGDGVAARGSTLTSVSTLTPEGTRLSSEVVAIEDAMYAAIDAMTNEDIHGTLDFLRTFVNGSPSGQALARRIALTDHVRR